MSRLAFRNADAGRTHPCSSGPSRGRSLWLRAGKRELLLLFNDPRDARSIRRLARWSILRTPPGVRPQQVRCGRIPGRDHREPVAGDIIRPGLAKRWSDSSISRQQSGASSRDGGPVTTTPTFPLVRRTCCSRGRSAPTALSPDTTPIQTVRLPWPRGRCAGRDPSVLVQNWTPYLKRWVPPALNSGKNPSFNKSLIDWHQPKKQKQNQQV